MMRRLPLSLNLRRQNNSSEFDQRYGTKNQSAAVFANDPGGHRRRADLGTGGLLWSLHGPAVAQTFESRRRLAGFDRGQGRLDFRDGSRLHPYRFVGGGED